MADGRVRAEWACIGKAPATLDYRVLATSGGDTNFGSYVGRYTPGAPDSGVAPDAPGGPPWVTFGPLVTPSGETLISVSVLEPAQDRDKSGRPISPQRLFLIPYADVAGAGASYQGLWEALADVALPTADHQPTAVVLGRQAADSLVATIEYYTVERMTALAAMILEDRVVLADTAALRRGERLAVLDAAVALLPYGFRAALSASSAVNNVVSHKIDLVFAEFANEASKQVMMPLSAAAVPVPRTTLGRSYQDLLRKKAQPPGPGLHAVIEHLWAATAPCSLQHQATALEILAELDFDGSLREALGDGTATREHVLALLRRDAAAVEAAWRSPAMSEPLRRRALRLLLDDPAGPAPAELLTHWPTVEDDLWAEASTGLNAGDITLATWCLHSAGQCSAIAEDRFLARLLASKHAAPKDRPSRFDALVRLLDQREAPRPGALPLTREQVCQDTDPEQWAFQLFRILLARQAGPGAHPERAMAWASWLCLPGPASAAGLPPWAGTLPLVCDPGTGPAGHAALDPADLTWAEVTIRLAAFSGRLAQALTVIAGDLVWLACVTAGASGQPRRTASDDEDVRFLLESLDVDLWSARLAPNVVAMTDTTRVLLGGQARDFPATTDDERTLDSYLDGLGHVLGAVIPPEWRSWLAQRFLHKAAPGDADGSVSTLAVCLLNGWSADPDLAADVARHVAAMPEAARPVDGRLAASYWDNVAREPTLAGYATAPRLAAAVRAALADPERELARQTRPTGVSSTRLALTCHDARLAGLPAVEMLRILGQAGCHRIHPRRFHELIGEFQCLLRHDPALAPQAQADMLACYDAIAQGAFGADYADAFAKEVMLRCKEDIRLSEEMIQRVASPRSEAARRKLIGRITGAGRRA